MRIVRHNNAPVWGGWLFVTMGAGTLALRHWRPGADPGERLALWLVAGIFLVTGGWVVLRRFQQTVTILRRTQQVIIEDRTRFGTRRRAISFGEVREVTVEAWTDPDPDARPFQQTTYRVIARLGNGTELPLTDFGLDAGAMARIRDDVLRLLGGGERGGR